jgi:voltage-gated potassium channel
MSLREKLRGVIFGIETRAGRLFDVFLLIAIVISVLLVMLETVVGIGRAGPLDVPPARYVVPLRVAGWVFTALFTVEYLLRLYCAERRLSYAFSFFGIVDFLAVGPVYAGLLVPGGQYFALVRLLRVLRIFRVFGMAAYVRETRMMLTALRSSARRIIVFLIFVLTMVVMLGSLMYLIEGRNNEAFSSIPRSIYWAVVTLTTVGYGDISPKSPLGQAIAGLIMILGYSLIVVPTGFVSVAVAGASAEEQPPPAAAGGEAGNAACGACGRDDHDPDARFCKACGAELPPRRE